MKKYLLFNKSNKEVIGSEIRPDNDEIITADDVGSIEIGITESHFEYYFENGELSKRQDRPSDNHIWIKDRWVIDNKIVSLETKSKRFRLLSESDWTDTVSAQTRLPNYQQWQDYRQALRDIPQQSGYPENVIWPEQPQ